MTSPVEQFTTNRQHMLTSGDWARSGDTVLAGARLDVHFARLRDGRGAVDITETAGVAVGIAVPPRSDAPVGTAAPAGAMDELDRRLVAVEERLTTAAGDRSLCELSGTDTVIEGVLHAGSAQLVSVTPDRHRGFR